MSGSGMARCVRRAGPSLSRRAGRLVVLLALCMCVFGGLTGVASAELNVSGTWDAVYHCEHGWCAGQDFPSKGEVWVQAPGSNQVFTPTGALVGTLNGNQLETHGGQAGGYEYDVVRNFSADGNSWTGPLSDSNGSSGTDTGVRVSKPAPTATQVSCTYIVLTAQDQCTATVGDAGATPTTPTGTVTFSTSDGGGFALGATCNLAASQTSPSTAFCTVTYTPPGGGALPNIKASYAGDSAHSASAGTTQYGLPTNVQCAAGDAVGPPCFGAYPTERAPQVCADGTASAACKGVDLTTSDTTVKADGSSSVGISCGGGASAAAFDALRDVLLNMCTVSVDLLNGGDLDQALVDELLPGAPDGPPRDAALNAYNDVLTTMAASQNSIAAALAAMERSTAGLNGAEVPQALRDEMDRLVQMTTALTQIQADWADCAKATIRAIRSTASAGGCAGAAAATATVESQLQTLADSMAGTVLQAGQVNSPELRAALQQLAAERTATTARVSAALKARSDLAKSIIGNIKGFMVTGHASATQAAAKRTKPPRLTRAARRLARRLTLGAGTVVLSPGHRTTLNLNSRSALRAPLHTRPGRTVHLMLRAHVVRHGATKTLTRRLTIHLKR